MSGYNSYVKEAKHQIQKLGDELDELDRKVKSDCHKAGHWYSEQMERLRNEWVSVRTKFDRLAEHHTEKAEDAYQQAKSDAETQWNALQAAVKTYRQHVEQSASQS